MRLTRVDIHGFKSFADRTPLDLPPGLTAIVGPNGCGKSNVIDAVKWALGEQRASALRGKDMTDVVFKGNGARAARNFAEVSLHFDNHDGTLPTEYTEVVITRRLFRSGESEYLVNRQPVRLKDIRNLLMDTGLGTGAYSVMEQGRIDAILSANPTERRRIFDEAAGISRYRARRRESENKLARTEQNLLRLSDVVDELEKRERSLKQQAGRARSYIEARDRIRLLRSRYYVHQWRSLGATMAEQAVRTAELSAAEGAARKELETARAEVSALGERLSAVRREIDEAAEAFRRASSEVDAVGERHASVRERIAEIDQGAERLGDRIRGLQAALAERRAEADQMERRVAELAAESVRWEAAVAEAEQARAEAQSQLEAWEASTRARREQALDRVALLTEARNRRGQAASRHAALSASRERLAEQVASLSGEVDELTALRERVAEEARALDASHAEVTVRAESHRARAAELMTALAGHDQDLARRREELAAANSRCEALDELINRRDGVSPGALTLIEDGVPGVEGLLVDALRAPRALAEAVEAALGATTQAVLVSDRATGVAALAHLESRDGGRVLLVPRDGVRAREGAAAGARLLDRLEVREHHDVFEALLGHVRLVDGREALSSCVPDGATVWVTLAGDLLDERGVLRGGASGEEGGLLARRAERDELAARCREIEAALAEAGSRREADQRDLDGVQEQLAVEERELRRLQTERDRTRERERHAGERHHTLSRDLGLRRTDLAGVVQEADKVQLELGAAQHDEQQLEEHVAADRLEEQAEELRHRELVGLATQRADELSAARLELSARKEREEALAAESRQVARSVEERAADVEHAKGEGDGLARRRAELEAELATLTGKADGLGEARDRCAGVLDEARGRGSELGSHLEQATEQVTVREGVLDRAASVLSEHRMASQETSIRREELRAKVLEELEVDLEAPALGAGDEDGQPRADDGAAPDGEAEGRASDTAPVEGQGAEDAAADGEACGAPALRPAPEALEALQAPEEEDVDWAAIAAEIDDLKGRLARMGNVNLEAVDELVEVEQRVTFLTGQRDDLMAAKKTLHDTIARLNIESRDRFQATFDEVSGYFRQIFRKLFRGGKADMTLEEGVDVLEAGIEITAAPPGKDPRTITLLSGGERTLTAVGLLFSLFKARPSPVCLLDEVDAALDETNIERFCSVLEDFLGESQFLVVTHARRTMSYADQVFGVTMAEHGVSQVLSLTVDEYQRRQGKDGDALAAKPTRGRGQGAGPRPEVKAAIESSPS